MYFSILLALLTWHLFGRYPAIAAVKVNKDETCPYQNTVNLTNKLKYENGSYLYQGILIPSEKQHNYDYDIKFPKTKKPVSTHLRGCVCEHRPCMKLCCEPDEYLDDKQNTSKCEKLTSEMKVSWELPILLKGDITKVVNIFKHFTTQVGLPCPEPEALVIELDKWKLKENGILYIPYGNSNFDTLDYCYSPLLNETSMEYILTPFICPVKNSCTLKQRINSYAMAVSVIFLIPTILVYLVLKELRGNLRGKLLICHLLSLTIGYIIIALINISGLQFDVKGCNFLGYTCYFFLLAAFLWLNVLCYDIWKNFEETNIQLNSRKSRKLFIIYSLYVWLTAGLATVVCVLVELSPRIDNIYKPGIGNQVCWLDTKRWSAAIYFYGPTLVILFFNFLTFVHLTAKIFKIRTDVARMTHREKFFQENAIVIFRLYLIMGISWLFDVLSYCMRNKQEWDFLFVLLDFVNAIQGLLIFSLFVLKRNVLNLLKNRFVKSHVAKPRITISTSTTNFSKQQSYKSEKAVVKSP
ncbi:G-protein coupled receptor Mth2-like [Calliphora vicina]|uniref:G-protein coupled receptor Mth2-like n=1 Tax=Calliphora vicina TaxID=7373 RepID=UPI00325ADEB4